MIINFLSVVTSEQFLSWYKITDIKHLKYESVSKKITDVGKEIWNVTMDPPKRWALYKFLQYITKNKNKRIIDTDVKFRNWLRNHVLYSSDETGSDEISAPEEGNGSLAVNGK